MSSLGAGWLGGRVSKKYLLSAIYAHRFSLENWFRLLERRNRLTKAGSPPGTAG